MPPQGGLRVWLLGGFRVELCGQPVPATAWRRSKAKAVVKRLALAPGHRLHREQLIDQLWPEQHPEKAAANLRKAVHFARQAMAPHSLAAHDGSLSLVGDPLWVDVDAFEALARDGSVQDAVALYGGELLPEDLYEPWTEPRREQLALRFTRLVLDWAGELERSGRDREAADALERLVGGDPLNEEAHVQLMRLHAFAGRTHLAVQWYQQLEARLADELGVRPSSPARSLYESVVAGRLAPANPVNAVPDAPAAIATVQRPAERKLSTLVVLDGAVVDDDAVAVLRAWGAAVLREDGQPTIAVFGSPRALEDHAVRGLRAALEVAAQSPAPTSIGVATGEVLVEAGPAPGDDRVLGSAVQIARLLSGAARPGTVFVHDRTYRSTGELFEFAPVRRLRPPAGEEPLVARELVAERPAAGLTTRRPELAMVGRESELAAVLSLAADVVDSARPRLVLVQGPAGIGKSRLVQEAVESIAARHPTTRVLQGRCRSAGRAVTYWALAEVIRQACGIAFDAPVHTAQEAVPRELHKLLDPLHLQPADLAATVFALAATAGIDLPGSPLARAQPKEVAEELARAWPRFTTACAVTGPAVLVVEDLHWADDALLEMVQRIAMRSAGPLLLLCTARTELGESHPGFVSAGDQLSTVSLRPLTGTASHELLEQLAARAPVPVDRRTEIVSKAEGNPFFLEQLVAHVAEGGAGSLPDSVLSVLAARIDALPDIERAVVQQAAVVGRIFWPDPIRRSLDTVDVSDALQSLERRGLVMTRPTSSLGAELELMFAHALVRDVAYSSLPADRRSVAHEQVGSWLEERAAGRRDELAELLAYHFVTAVDYLAGTEAADGGRRESLRRKAFDHLLVAGIAARRRFAVPRAVDLHKDALAHAVGDGERLQAFEAIGDDLESAFQGHEAMAAYLAALDIARANPTLARSRSRLCRKLAGLMAHTPGAFRASPDPAYVEQLVDEGLEFVEDDDIGRARLLLVRGACARLWQGSEPFGTIRGPGPDPIAIDERIDAATEALRIGAASGEPELVSASNDVLVVLLGVVGRYDLMLERAREQLESLTNSPRLTQADVTRKVAVLAIEVEGKLAEGAELARAAYELSQGSNPHQLMHTTYPLLVSLYHLGRWSELMGLLAEHLDAFGQDPALFCQFVRDGPVIGAIVHTHLGDFERAQDVAALVPDPQQDPETASAWQSRLAVLRGQPAVARDISGPKAFERRTYGPQHALAFVEALTALGDWAALRDFLPQARASVPGNALLAPFCDRAVALAEADSGHNTLAIVGLQRALDRFQELGAVLEVARTQQALAPLVSAAERERLLAAAAAAYELLGIAVRPAASSPAERIG